MLKRQQTARFPLPGFNIAIPADAVIVMRRRPAPAEIHLGIGPGGDQRVEIFPLVISGGQTAGLAGFGVKLISGNDVSHARPDAQVGDGRVVPQHPVTPAGHQDGHGAFARISLLQMDRGPR